MKLFALSLTAIMLGGCVTVTSEGQRVRVTTNGAAVQGCEFVGNVNSSSMMGGSAGMDRTQVDLQNQTAALGGNVVFLSTLHAGVELSAGARTTGEAYRCP